MNVSNFRITLTKASQSKGIVVYMLLHQINNPTTHTKKNLQHFFFIACVYNKIDISNR